MEHASRGADGYRNDVCLVVRRHLSDGTEHAEDRGLASDGLIYAGTTDLAGGGYHRSRISFVVYPDLADARAAIEELLRAGQGPGSHVLPYRMAQLEAWDLSDRAVCWYFHPSVECYALIGSVVVSGETLPTTRARLGPDWFSTPNAADARLLLESGLRHLFTIERYPVP